MARWVIHEEAADAALDSESVLRDVAEEIVEDARRLAPKGKTLKLSQSIRVESVTDSRAVVVADPRNVKSSPGNQAYAAHVERGTSDTKAQPFMAPAGLRYRS